MNHYIYDDEFILLSYLWLDDKQIPEKTDCDNNIHLSGIFYAARFFDVRNTDKVL